MKLKLLCCGLVSAVAAVAADLPWPSDFNQQVADNHPNPSGSQIAPSGSAVPIDGRVAASDMSAVALAYAEGRVLTFWSSNEALIDALARAGLFLVVH